jgi:BatD DUF11 like domain
MMGRLRGAGLAALLAMPVLAWSQPASADPAVQLNASANAVELGDSIQVQLSASGSDEAPSNPRLASPAGFVVVGPNVGTSQQISITGNGIVRSVGLNATWRVSATKLGEFTIGPATVTVDGQQWRSGTVSVRVVEKGSLPRRARRRGMSPFDDDFFKGFGLPGGSLFDDLTQPAAPPEPEAIPPELQIATAPDPNAFLRATITPAHAVVGQQVTFRVYAYGALGRFNENNPHEARRPDFFSVSLLDPNQPPGLYRVNIDGRLFVAAKIRDMALFPLKSGALDIGPMSIAFYGSRYVTNRHPEGLERSSNSLVVQVEEPPANGRPASYQVGNVGRFKLSAVVSGRQAQVSDSISVVATITGTGNPPTRLNTPDQHAVEWLEPSIQEQVKPDPEGNIAGTRVFTYILKLKQPGKIALGALSLDYYDPALGTYQTARVELGEVDVTPSKETQETKVTPTQTALAEHLQPRTQPSAPTASGIPLTDRRWYWWFLGALPIASLIVQRSFSVWRRYNGQRAAKAASPATLAHDALKAAAEAFTQGNHDVAVGQLERAVFSALEAVTSLKPRGLLRTELAQALIDRGLDEPLARESIQFLEQLEDARFASGSRTDAVLLTNAKQLIKRLLHAS